MDHEKPKKAVFAAKLLKSGRITIPEDAREKLGLKEGDWIKVWVERLEE